MDIRPRVTLRSCEGTRMTKMVWFSRHHKGRGMSSSVMTLRVKGSETRLPGLRAQRHRLAEVWWTCSLIPLCLAVLICWMRIILISLLTIVVRIEQCVSSLKTFKYCLAHGKWLMRTRHLYVWVHWKWWGWVFYKIVGRAHEKMVDTIMLVIVCYSRKIMRFAVRLTWNATQALWLLIGYNKLNVCVSLKFRWWNLTPICWY